MNDFTAILHIRLMRDNVALQKGALKHEADWKQISMNCFHKEDVINNVQKKSRNSSNEFQLKLLRVTLVTRAAVAYGKHRLCSPNTRRRLQSVIHNLAGLTNWNPNFQIEKGQAFSARRQWLRRKERIRREAKTCPKVFYKYPYKFERVNPLLYCSAYYQLEVNSSSRTLKSLEGAPYSGCTHAEKRS